ncbi:MAG: hypothetical protein HKM95_11710 [Inquilinus sp.]|nr:hypothetical protein [Inquilinus sp.]
MGTRSEPGRYDCHAKALPDEPHFTLIGRDPFAPPLIEAWAKAAEAAGEDREKVAEARALAVRMRQWRKLNKPPPEGYL